MHHPLHPLPIILIPRSKDIPAPSAFDPILELPIVHITVGVVVLPLALDRPQFPLPLVPFLGTDGQPAFTVTMPVIEVPLVDLPIMELIHSLTELAAVHELALELLIIGSVHLSPLAMLQVLRPRPLVDVPVFLVLVLAFTRGCEIVDVADVVTAGFEDEDTVGRVVLVQVAEEVLLVGEVEQECACEHLAA